jgi:hypothetical protein
MSTIRDVTKWICAEYLQTPALQLKAEQVQRLCGIGQTMCQLALDSLVASKFLRITSDGLYARVTTQYFSSSAIGAGFISYLDTDGRPVVQSDAAPGEPGTLVFRQPERRRHRSDAKVRKERAQWVRQWN